MSEEQRFVRENLSSYWRACEEGKAYIKRGCLMTVGASGDGKTCLIGRLIGEGFTARHNVTNALETDLRCKVKIVQCNKAWKRYEGSQTQILDH